VVGFTPDTSCARPGAEGLDMIAAVATSLLLFAAAAGRDAVVSHDVKGVVHDVIAVPTASGPEVWVSRTEGEKRLLHPLGRSLKRRAVPRDAVLAAVCPADGGYRGVLADARGLVTQAGERLVDAARDGHKALFAVPDPERIHFAPLCVTVDGVVEYRFFTERGLLVVRGDAVRSLAFTHRARSYSGGQHHGFRSEKGYAAAASIYVPHLHDVDIDADGDTDLVLRHEDEITVFARGPDGALEARPLAEIDVSLALGLKGDEAMNLIVDDVDGDRRADVVVGVAPGLLAEESSGWVLASSAKGPFSHPRRLWTATGLRIPVAVVHRPDDGAARTLVTARVDTSIMALGRALVSSSLDVKIAYADLEGSERAEGPALVADVDIRRGEMAGALPIFSVDLDGDRRPELVDVGRRGQARVHRGTTAGFERSSTWSHEIPSFAFARAAPSSGAVVFVSEPWTREKKARDLRPPAREMTTVVVIGPIPPPVDELDVRLPRGER